MSAPGVFPRKSRLLLVRLRLTFGLSSRFPLSLLLWLFLRRRRRFLSGRAALFRQQLASRLSLRLSSRFPSLLRRSWACALLLRRSGGGSGAFFHSGGGSALL